MSVYVPISSGHHEVFGPKQQERKNDAKSAVVAMNITAATAAAAIANSAAKNAPKTIGTMRYYVGTENDQRS